MSNKTETEEVKKEHLPIEEELALINAEKDITTHVKSLVPAAKGFENIRDKKLYRLTHKTFEQYCQDRWKFSRQYVNEMIRGARAIQGLPPELETLVSKVKVASAVAKVDPAKRLEVVELAVESATIAGTGVTAKTIESAASVVKKKAEKFVPPPEVRDKVLYLVPDDLHELWNRRNEAADMMDLVSQVKCRVEKGIKDQDPLFREVNNSLVAMLTNCYGTLGLILPYAVCTTCNGKNITQCAFCKGRGLISKFKYESPAVTKSVREMREKLAKSVK
jgi:hypothetical protein